MILREMYCLPIIDMILREKVWFNESLYDFTINWYDFTRNVLLTDNWYDFIYFTNKIPFKINLM